MKISNVLQIIKPEYVYLRLKPNNSIRNNSTHKLARAITTLYRGINQNIRREEKLIKAFGRKFVVGTKYAYQVQPKVSYLVVMEKQDVGFYFVIPKNYLSFLKEKITDAWKGLTLEEVKRLPEFSESATKYQLHYEKEDALSLAVDRRDNDLLSSNMNALDILEEGDRVAIMYNFLPISQRGWQHTYRYTMNKIKSGQPVERNKTGWRYVLKLSLSLINTLINEAGEAISGSKPKKDTNIMENLIDRINGGRKVSDATAKKASSTVLDTQIVVMSESEDKTRELNAARSLAQSFDTISEDNKLKYKPSHKFKYTDYSIGAERNRVSDLEAQHFLSMPGRELLERYDFISKVETQETEVPEDLREGTMCIGENTYRGKKQKAYLSTDREYKNLTLVLIGPTRAGKSTLMGNLGKDAIRNGECVIVFDFINNCDLSDDIAGLFPKEKVLNIECGDLKKLEGMGYNEIGRSADPLESYENAKRSATQLRTLIDAIATNDAPLTPKMKRHLQAASLIVFSCGGNIRDVFEVLTDHEKRYDFIERVPKSLQTHLQKHMDSLSEIDELNKKGEVVDTKYGIVSGIIDRMTELEQNTHLEMMLSNDTSKNIDLVKEIQKNQLICIRMPERAYPTDAEKDVICTYWMTKLMLALQLRAHQIPDRSKQTKVNLMIDELYQVRTTERLFKGRLSRLAKLSLKPIISCHYLNQIHIIREELRSANASYMLISGCDKKNYKELESELYPYQEEDLLRLPRYHSLNLIKNKDGYGKFITKLPYTAGK